MADAPFPPGMLDEIERFLAADTAAPGRDLYPELFASPLFFPLQRQQEMAAMMRIARGLGPKVVIEVGSDKGGSVYHWLKAQPSITHLVAIEPRGLPYASLLERAFPGVRFSWQEASSYEPRTVERVRHWLDGQPIDVLFLDGDKLGFLRDWNAYLPMMAPGGLVFMHDITDAYAGGPGMAFGAVRECGHRTEVIVDRTDSALALARQEEGLPPASAYEAWARHWGGRSCGLGVIYLGEGWA